MLVPPLANPFFKKNRDKFMPLGLMSLAAVLLQQNISAFIYEPKIRLLAAEDYHKVAKDILKHNPSVIGFSTWCTSYPGIILLVAEIKKLSPNSIVIFGGPQASILPKQTMEKYPIVDYILTGEADLTFPKLIHTLKNKDPKLSKIPGLYFRHNSQIQQNATSSIVSNLDDLPIPAYHLIPKQKAIKLDVGRGCPFKCTYCTTNNFFSKKFRMKSVDRIISEMLQLYGTYKVREFEFTHDLFTLRKNDVLQLCKNLVEIREKKNIRFNWVCSARIDCIDQEMIFKMKEAGCTSIFYGIESGSEIIQQKIRKNLHLPKAELIADISRKEGMDMHASYIMGFPEETKKDLNLTLQHIFKLLLQGALVQSSVLALLPGTPLYDRHKDKLKFDGHFSNFSQTICNDRERDLIRNDPEIFSSFYYLPVKTMKRDEMVYLSRLINKLPQFINTFFIIGDQLHDELKNYNLLEIFKQEYTQNKTQISQSPIILVLIEYLTKFINDKKIADQFPHILDVFNYEAYSAVLKKLFTSFQLLDYEVTKSKINQSDTIEPNPVYKILQTSFLLESVLPKENGWRYKDLHCRTGKYYYLLTASSEIKVQRLKISQKEMELTATISKLSVKKYVKEVKHVASEEYALKWLNKLQNLGLVRIIQNNE